MNLGEMIAALRKFPPDAPFVVDGVGLGGVDSYRGYYEQLALEPSSEQTTVARALRLLEGAVNMVMTGYKGGKYRMTLSTPLWVSHYGEASGLRVVDVALSGHTERVVVVTEQECW